MESFIKFKDLFRKDKQENDSLFQELKCGILTKDQKIATWLGIDAVEVVSLIRRTTEIFDWLRHKEATGKVLSTDELDLYNQPLCRQENKAKEPIRKEADIKKMLLLTECGIVDYGIEEMLDIINPDDETKTSTNLEILNTIPDTETATQAKVQANCKPKRAMELVEISSKESVSKRTRQEMVLTGDFKEEIMNNSHQSTALTPQTKEKIYKSTTCLTLWDIPNETRANQIRKCLSFYGRAIVKRFMSNGKTKAAQIELTFRNPKRKVELQNSWAVHFVNGKMLRVTGGLLDKETLVERSKYKSIIKNLPKTAIETSLLRQLRNIKAKAVYISTNSNGNQRGTASIYFATKEDQDRATSQTVFYFNTKLEWAEPGGDENKKIYRQYSDKSRIPKPKTTTKRPKVEKDTTKIQDENSGNLEIEIAEGSKRKFTGKDIQLTNSLPNKKKSSEVQQDMKVGKSREKEKEAIQTGLLYEIIRRLESLEEQQKGGKAPNRS